MGKLWKRAFDNIEEIVLSIFFVNMCIFVMIQIVSRYLFQNPWLYTEEVARFSYVWVTFFGMAIATKFESHICVDILLSLTKGRWNLFARVAVGIVSLVLYVGIALVGIRYVVTSAVRVSPAMEISMAYVTISLPLGAILSIVRLIPLIRRDITNLQTE